MTDTHTHIYFPDYGEKIHEIMNRCESEGVTHFILPNVDESTVSQVKDFHKRYPSVTSMAMGLHPTEVKEDWEEVVEKIEKELSEEEYVAVGEVGMDLYWDKTFEEEQKEAFAKQLEIASSLNLPVIIHCREALDETLEIIERVKPKVPLIFHSFTGSLEDVKKIRKICDPYFGINGVVTYKNAPALREALHEITPERLLLETDSPYLTPVPHRGKRNDSSHLKYIRDKIAEEFHTSPEDIENITDQNARIVFGL